MKARNTSFLALFLLLYAACASAQKIEVNQVIDGDTVEISVKNMTAEQLRSLYGDTIKIRIAGIDTPETHGVCDAQKSKAQEAKSFVKEQINKASNIELLPTGKRDGFGRALADIAIDGQKLSELLLRERLAVAYEERKNESWGCEI